MTTVNMPPDWALKIAGQLWDEEPVLTGATAGPLMRAFARFIVQHEKEPVDPLLIEARELCLSQAVIANSNKASDISEGLLDDCPHHGVPLALAALRRGIELGKSS